MEHFDHIEDARSADINTFGGLFIPVSRDRRTKDKTDICNYLGIERAL